MSAGAKSQETLTYYDFNFSGTSDDTVSVTVTGVFGVNGLGVITSMTGNVSGIVSPTTGVNGSIGLLPASVSSGVSFEHDNIYRASAPYLTATGVGFYTGGQPANPLTASNAFDLYYEARLSTYVLAWNNYLQGGHGTMTSSLSVSPVPEIDGSLIPQVGFLIACLFLILGRRKENTEPILAV